MKCQTSTLSLYCYPHFRIHLRVGSTPNESSLVRQLNNSNFVGNVSFNITIPTNTKEVAFYIPDNYNLEDVLYVESSNADVTSTFTSSNMNVNDAGSNPVGYNKYIAVIGGTGYPNSATYKVTIKS